MNLAAAQTALKLWVATLAGLDPAFVVLENEPRPRTNGAIALLSWVSDVGVGVDESRYDVDATAAPTANNVSPFVVGDRLVAVQVGFETTDQRPDAPSARALAMKLRDRLRLPASLAALAAANLGLVGADPITPADYRVDQRWIARAVLGLRFNATSTEAEDVTPTTGTLESVDVTSAVTDVDGTPLPAAQQWDHHNIP